MTDQEIARMGMYNVVQKICRDEYTVLSAYAPFVTVFTVYENILIELKSWLMKQLDNPAGIVIDKNKRRKWLEDDASLLSAALFVYARGASLMELSRRVKYAPYKLATVNEKELLGICHQLLSDGEDNLAGIAPFLIDAAWLLAFEAKINDFMSFIGAPASARADKKKATEEIKRLVPEIGLWLREALDPVMEYFKAQDSLLYATYKNGRKIVDSGSRKPALKGCVVDSEGNPMKGLIVRIAGTTRKSITSAKGNFRFIQMKAGKYMVVVFDKKTELVRKTVDVPHEGILNVEM